MKHILINSHVHSTGSDGKLAPEDMVKEAIAAGISYICFCDHYKRPEAFRKLSSHHGPFNYEFDYGAYVNEIRGLQKKYKDKIEISLGTEMDWLEGYEEWTANEIKDHKKLYDQIIGSVHYVLFGKEYLSINTTPEKWMEIANGIGMKEFVGKYYHLLRVMIKSNFFTCLGHLDMVKIYNKDSRLFNEQDEWYKKEVLKTLDEAAKAKICIEINTHGFKKDVGAQYPSEWILKEMKKRNIPITISSDAHRTGEINDKLIEAFALARKAGYKSIMKFKDRKMIEVKI
ncbi:MAG: histidinol-phosphatase HisJ [Nanoarchaeota archaeon]|nr:histidinol-phosphatase HisJ [Nanoarchaeota archaeon]